MILNDSIYDILIDIIGRPTNEYTQLALYVVACFLFILCVKFIYDFISRLLGFKR